MVSFVSQSLRDAPGCGGVSAMFPTLAALALFAMFATTTLTAFSAEAAVSSDDISESVPLSADLESGESEEEFSSDIDVPDFYTGADGDVFALAEDAGGRFWVGTDGGGLSMSSPSTTAKKERATLRGESSSPSDAGSSASSEPAMRSRAVSSTARAPSPISSTAAASS